MGSPTAISLPSDAQPPNANPLLDKGEGNAVVGVPVTFDVTGGTSQWPFNASEFSADASVQIAGSVPEDEGSGWLAPSSGLGELMEKILPPGSRVTRTFAFTVQSDEPAISLTVTHTPLTPTGPGLPESHSFTVTPPAGLVAPTGTPTPESTGSTSTFPVLAFGQKYRSGSDGVDFIVGKPTRTSRPVDPGYAAPDVHTYRFLVTVTSHLKVELPDLFDNIGIDGSVGNGLETGLIVDREAVPLSGLQPGQTTSFPIWYVASTRQIVSIAMSFAGDNPDPQASSYEQPTFEGKAP